MRLASRTRRSVIAVGVLTAALVFPAVLDAHSLA